MSIIKLKNNSIHDSFSLGTKNNKNMIINGSFNVHQRGTYKASITNLRPNSADLFYESKGGNSQTIASSIENDVPTELANLGLSKSLKNTWTTAQDGNQFNRHSIKYPFEQRDLHRLTYGANAKSSTLSFWVKCNKTVTQGLEFKIIGTDLITGGFQNRYFSSRYTINSANTWEKKIINIPALTDFGFYNFTESQLKSSSGGQLDFKIYVGSYYTGSSSAATNTWENNIIQYAGINNTFGNEAGDYVQFAGVQLEEGNDATEFEVVPYLDELQRCKRYFQTFGDYGAGDVSGNRIYSQRYGSTGSMVTVDVPVEFWRTYGFPEFSIGGGGVIDTYFINQNSMQLYDASDSAFYIYDLAWRALIT